MRTKTYVFEDIKSGMELIKEKYGPEALIVDIKTLGHNGSSKCEISVLVEEERIETGSPSDILRRKTEEVWEFVHTLINERLSEVEKYLFLKRVEAYPLSLRVVFDKMIKNGVDLKLAFDLVSQVYVEAGDLVDSLTKAYYFVKHVIKKRMKLYELRKDSSPVLLFGPKEGDKSLIAGKLAHLFRNLGFGVFIVSLSRSNGRPHTSPFHFKNDGSITHFVADSEEEVTERISRSGGKKAIVDFDDGNCDEFLGRLGCAVEKLLVLPAGARDEKIVRYCERYRSIYSGVVFTRIDEEPSLGHILEHMLKLQVPLCLLGAGGDVTEILSPEEDRFFRILVEGNLWTVKEERQYL